MARPTHRQETLAPPRPRRQVEVEPALPARRPVRPAAYRSQLRSDLLAVASTLLGLLMVLALWREGSAGWAGGFLVGIIRLWMGQLVYVAPALCFLAAVALACDYRRVVNAQSALGLIGLLVVLFGWAHLSTTQHGAVFDSTGARLAALLGRDADLDLLSRADGGILGAVVMSALFPLGPLGSYVTLGAVGVASLLLLTELTLRGVAHALRERSRKAARRARTGAVALKERYQAANRRRAERLAALAASLEEEPPAPPDEAAAAHKGRPLFLEVSPPESRPARRAAVRRAAAPSSPVQETLPLDLDPTASPVAEGPDLEPAPPAEDYPEPSQPVAARSVPAGAYTLPPLDLLDAPVPRPRARNPETEANIGILESTLGQFGIEAEVVEIADGPSVTRYEIRLGEGIKVRKILDLADNIAMSLAAMSVRVEAPIPGKAAIGIEVPKKQAHVVTLRECLASQEAASMPSTLTFVLGRDVGGRVRCADLARMPHLLVAGATNSGKSVCLNVLIASLLFRARPDELKLIMIDPKRVELTLFDGIPHLVHPVVKDVKQAAGILRWVVKEMNQRYDRFAQLMTRNLDGYNEKMEAAGTPEARLPYLVVVIDELADLMMQQGAETEQLINRLAALARATGIHLVIATQRPSVDVITGLIKANIPSRIAFSVSSQVDSRTILDTKGAESLIGRGDMLFKPIDAQKPVRIQGAFLREAEVERLVNFLKKQGRPEYVAESLASEHSSEPAASEEEVEDEMFEQAARFVVSTGNASTSMVQRKFKLGYTRAARLMDLMEARGIVSPLDGARPRQVLVSIATLDDHFRALRESPGGVRSGPGSRRLRATAPAGPRDEEELDDSEESPFAAQ